MSVSILSRPTKSGCNWNALGNPVIFKLQRQDYAFDQIQDNGGFVRLRINGVNVTSYFLLGNSVYYDGAIFATSATITASVFSGGHTLITVNVAYVSTDAGIINNLSNGYQIVYNFKSIAGVELLASDLSITPNTVGIALLNASMLKNLLSATWTLPVTVNEVDSTGSIEFYLSYQEYYNGALQGSVTNDSANPIHGLLGANQIGSPDGSNMLAYFPGSSTKKWLTRFQLNSVLKGLKMWRDWPFTLSFIHPDATADLKLRVNQFDASGTEVATNISAIASANDNHINRVIFEQAITPETTSLQVKLLQGTAGAFTNIPIPSPGDFSTGWTNEDSGENWTIGGSIALISTLTNGGDQSKILSTIPVTVVTVRDVFVRATFDLSIPNTKQVDILFMGLSGSWLTLATQLNVIGTGSAVGRTLTTTTSVTERTFTKFGIKILSDDTVAGDITVDNVAFLYSDVIPNVLETLDIEVADVCEYDEDRLPIAGQNAIMLQWKNSIGADAFWSFPWYHEVGYNIKDRKAKKILLIDQDLTAVQWEAIQELNSPNEVFRVPVIDLENTNTVISTSRQVGKQVYMVAKDGTKTGVIVIPSSDKINARDSSHRISIEIELPEFFEA